MGRRKDKEVDVRVKGETVRSTACVKYLGVTFSMDTHYGNHIRDVTDRAVGKNNAVRRWAEGVQAEIYSTVRSFMVYAAPVWHRVVTKIGRYRNVATRVQRQMILKVGATYKTISTEAPEVIAGVPPFDLQVRELRSEN